MVNRHRWKLLRASTAVVMSLLLVATPLSATLAPAPTLAPVENFSESAHAQALIQLGYQAQPCQEGEARAERDTNGAIWFLGGCVLGFIALGAAYLIEPSPPASALVGQDAEFVAQYTDCYVDRAQEIQQRSALYGCLTGAVASTLFYVVVMAASAATI